MGRAQRGRFGLGQLVRRNLPSPRRDWPPKRRPRLYMVPAGPGDKPGSKPPSQGGAQVWLLNGRARLQPGPGFQVDMRGRRGRWWAMPGRWLFGQLHVLPPCPAFSQGPCPHGRTNAFRTPCRSGCRSQQLDHPGPGSGRHPGSPLLEVHWLLAFQGPAARIPRRAARFAAWPSVIRHHHPTLGPCSPLAQGHCADRGCLGEAWARGEPGRTGPNLLEAATGRR